MRGTFSYNISYRRNGRKPWISGSLKIEDGSIDFFKFTELSLNLEQPVINEDSLKFSDKNRSFFSSLIPWRLEVSDFSLKQNNTIKVAGKGSIPLNEEDELDVNVSVYGDILSILPQLDPFFVETSSIGIAKFTLAGSVKDPVVASGHLKLDSGEIRVAFGFKKLENISIELDLLPKERFIRVVNASALLDNRSVEIINFKSLKIENETRGEIELLPIIIMNDGLNFGILALKTDPKGILFNIESIMEKGSPGTFVFEGKKPDEEFLIAGPVEHPYVRGKIKVMDTKLTYPPLVNNKKQAGLIDKILMATNWDLQVVPFKDNRYFREEPISSLPVTGKIFLDARIDNSRKGLEFQGIISEDEFQASGQLVSTRGMIEFLGTRFFIDRITLTFEDISKFESISSNEKKEQFPIISGRAKTTIRDSTGTGIELLRDIYLIIYSENKETGEILDYCRLDNLKFALSFEPTLNRFIAERKINKINSRELNPFEITRTQKEILALLGYSGSHITGKIQDIVGLKAANTLIKPILRPVEKTISRKLGFDEFRIQPRIGMNIFGEFLHKNDPNNYNNKASIFDPKYLFMSSQFILGKYITQNLYFNYIGQIASSSHINDNSEPNLGLSYVLGLEYRISPSLLIEFQYDYLYNRYRNKGDKKMWFKHIINLK